MPHPVPPFAPAATAAALGRLLERSHLRQAEVVRRSDPKLDKATVSKMLHGERLTWPNLNGFLAAIGCTYTDLEAELATTPPAQRPIQPASELGAVLQLLVDQGRRLTRLEEELAALSRRVDAGRSDP